MYFASIGLIITFAGLMGNDLFADISKFQW